MLFAIRPLWLVQPAPRLHSHEHLSLACRKTRLAEPQKSRYRDHAFVSELAAFPQHASVYIHDFAIHQQIAARRHLRIEMQTIVCQHHLVAVSGEDDPFGVHASLFG